MTTVRLHFWAGAKAAAGTEFETWPAESVEAALTAARDARQDSGFDRVLGVCTFLVAGVAVRGDALIEPLSGPVEVDVLPPYAGG